MATPTLEAHPQRPCHGCAHSAGSAPFPGTPSGERACCFCMRNPYHFDGRNFEPLRGPDGRVMEWWKVHAEELARDVGHFPIDNYRSLDFLTQLIAKDAKHKSELEHVANCIVDTLVSHMPGLGLDPLRALDARRRLGEDPKDG